MVLIDSIKFLLLLHFLNVHHFFLLFNPDFLHLEADLLESVDVLLDRAELWILLVVLSTVFDLFLIVLRIVVFPSPNSLLHLHREVSISAHATLSRSFR